MALHSRTLSAVLSALLLAAPVARAATLTPEELYERVSPSIWLVVNDMGGGKGALGSAVVIAPGMLVTNCHVVDKAHSLYLVHEQRRFPALLQYRDPSRDLCQLLAPGVHAPAVRIAAASHLRVGAKVYALGNPEGLELTLSDGLVSALRRDRVGDLEYVQISVPISHGSSGGGLFDAEGRLVGITTAGMKDGQNLNFALPAEWVADLPKRAAGKPAVARVDAPDEAAPAAAAPPAAAPDAAPPSAVVSAPNVFEYHFREGLTRQVRTVTYRADRRDGSSDAAALAAAIGGEFAAAMPPGGWVTGVPQAGATWELKYHRGAGVGAIGMKLHARTLGENTMDLDGRSLRIVGVEFTGYTERSSGAWNNGPAYYKATLWYAPELGQVVNFKVHTRGGRGSTTFDIDEQFQLVAARVD